MTYMANLAALAMRWPDSHSAETQFSGLSASQQAYGVAQVSTSKLYCPEVTQDMKHTYVCMHLPSET